MIQINGGVYSASSFAGSYKRVKGRSHTVEKRKVLQVGIRPSSAVPAALEHGAG